MPALIVARGSESRLTFRSSIDALAPLGKATLSAIAGETSAQETLVISPASTPLITAPGKQFVRFGERLSFTISGADASDLPVQLGANALPPGAIFDNVSGEFEWTPNASQAGVHEIAFTAINSGGAAKTAQVVIDVDSGSPVVSASETVMCSPGAIATLNGKWLTGSDETLSDPSGNSLILAGTRVSVNGQYAAVLFASRTKVKFLCPALGEGTPLSVVVESATAAGEPVHATMEAAAPVILSAADSGVTPGGILFAGSDDQVVERSPRITGRPAQGGDEIVMWVTGLGASVAPSISVQVDGLDAEVRSISAVTGSPGLSAVQVRVPQLTTFGAVPIQLQITMPDGSEIRSNTIAIESEL
jgi:uncharacterized protein (TIGR03437 family)